jgi:hypothetical protein
MITREILYLVKINNQNSSSFIISLAVPHHSAIQKKNMQGLLKSEGLLVCKEAQFHSIAIQKMT